MQDEGRRYRQPDGLPVPQVVDVELFFQNGWAKDNAQRFTFRVVGSLQVKNNLTTPKWRADLVACEADEPPMTPDQRRQIQGLLSEALKKRLAREVIVPIGIIAFGMKRL